MPDVWDQAEQSLKQQQPSQQQSQTKPSGDVWDQAEQSLKSGASPSSPVSQSQHGILYSLADKLLNTNTTPSTGNLFVDTLNSVSPANPSILQGFGKGILSTASGLGSIFNKVTGSDQPFNQENLKGLINSNNPGQSVGKGAEQVGEFFLPTGEAGILGKLGTEALKSGVISAAQSGGDPLATAVGAASPLVFNPIAKAAGKVVSNVLGITTGAGEKAIQRAFDNPNSSGLVNAMSGKIGAEDVANNVIKSVEDYRDAASQKYLNDINAAINNGQIQNWEARAGKIVSDLQNKAQSRIRDFGVTVGQNASGKATIDTHAASSDIATDGKDLLKKIMKWGNDPSDLTPAGLDNLKKNVISEQVGKGGKIGAYAKSLYDSLKDSLNANIPGYENATKPYAQAQDVLDELRQAVSAKPNGESNGHAVVSKIQYLLKQPTDYRANIIKKLPNGEDLLDQIAGLHLQNYAPRGLARILLGGEGLHAILSPHPASIPAMAGAALAGSPRIVGQGARIAGMAAQNPAVNALARFAPKAIPAAVDESVQP